LLKSRHRMATAPREEAFPDLPQFSGGGVQPGVDIDSNASLSALMDDAATWVSFDRDFARFQELRWLDPSAQEPPDVTA